MLVPVVVLKDGDNFAELLWITTSSDCMESKNFKVLLSRVNRIKGAGQAIPQLDCGTEL
jgi:hypothetical protein